MKNKRVICPDCKEKMWSPMDKSYLKLYGTCWECDQKRWQSEKLGLEEFERRENLAIKLSSYD